LYSPFLKGGSQVAYSRRTSGRRNYSGRRRRRSKYSAVERQAFLNGLVERGLKNPDSRITESFNKGKQAKSSKKKSLF